MLFSCAIFDQVFRWCELLVARIITKKSSEFPVTSVISCLRGGAFGSPDWEGEDGFFSKKDIPT